MTPLPLLDPRRLLAAPPAPLLLPSVCAAPGKHLIAVGKMGPAFKIPVYWQLASFALAPDGAL